MLIICITSFYQQKKENDRAYQHLLKIKCYFVTFYAVLESGLNEHSNGLSCQYFPNKTAFMDIEDCDI
ncbi:MAG: hypothetical protein HAW62_02520 [Endozoicomonadaceae bacterium]|nr:hypothetical protein [Endozoicomonadaceae bacterium]